MPRQPAKRSTRILGLVLLCLIAAAAAVWLRQAGRAPAPPPGATSDPGDHRHPLFLPQVRR